MKTNIGCATVYTGTNGRKYCTGNCRFCSQAGHPLSERPYQGTLEDIRETIRALPNLKEVYLLGNPDPSVDTDFCNEAAKLFVENGCKVMFSTSGWGGKQTMEKLLDGISPSDVKYVSFSVDSLIPETVKFLKGISLPLEVVEEGISYCIERGFSVKIQPTLWDVNQDEAQKLIRYFLDKYDIRWFTFHFGSMQTYRGKENHHVSARGVRKLHDEIMELAQELGLDCKIPKSILTKDEYKDYIDKYTTHCTDKKPYDLQVWLTSEGPKAAYCSVLPSVCPEMAVFDLSTEDRVAPCGPDCKQCPVQEATLGPNFDTQGLIPVCLYYKPSL